MARFWTAVAVALVLAELIVAAPKWAWPDAVFTTEPVSRSAWVTMWLAVQVIVPFGAMLAGVPGQVGDALSSVTVNGAARVTLPVLRRT